MKGEAPPGARREADRRVFPQAPACSAGRRGQSSRPFLSSFPLGLSSFAVIGGLHCRCSWRWRSDWRRAPQPWRRWLPGAAFPGWATAAAGRARGGDQHAGENLEAGQETVKRRFPAVDDAAHHQRRDDAGKRVDRPVDREHRSALCDWRKLAEHRRTDDADSPAEPDPKTMTPTRAAALSTACTTRRIRPRSGNHLNSACRATKNAGPSPAPRMADDEGEETGAAEHGKLRQRPHQGKPEQHPARCDAIDDELSRTERRRPIRGSRTAWASARAHS